MYFLHLIYRASRMLDPFNVRFRFFGSGVEWMRWQMIQIRNVKPGKLRFNGPAWTYGLMKYGICLSLTGFAGFAFYLINPWLIPFSLIVFYLAEIHFLFLFPLLIDQEAQPLSTGIKMIYRIGLIRALLNVIPIGFYMLIGLLNLKNPLLNWYRGSLSILLWYEDEKNHKHVIKTQNRA